MFTYLQIQSFESSGCIDSSGVPTLKCLEVVFNNVLLLASGLVVLILFVMIVIGAFKYVTSAGDAGKAGEARKTIMYAFLGLILFMSSYLIINVVQFLFIGDPADGAPSLLEFKIPEFKPGELDPPKPSP
jgi:Type IV secretion system pilin